MLATSGIARNVCLGAISVTLLLSILTLLNYSLSAEPNARLLRPHSSPGHYVYGNGKTATSRIPAVATAVPLPTHGAGGSRIKKVSALMGESNHLYEAALQTHEKHNEMWGYEMTVLRERIAPNYWMKPSYLLATMVEELAKPEADRNEWLVWCNPDTIVLNPLVPLEVFLPPDDLKNIHVVATHDAKGVNSGVFFLRVSQTTLKLLIEVLGVPLKEIKDVDATVKDAPALDIVLDYGHLRGKVVFQPKSWFNAFHVDGEFEGYQGSMLVHFTDVTADKWIAMDRYLSNVTAEVNPWEKQLNETGYEAMLGDFWARYRQGETLLEEVKDKVAVLEIGNAAENLRWRLDHDADRFNTVIDGILNLKGKVNSLRPLKGEGERVDQGSDREV